MILTWGYLLFLISSCTLSGAVTAMERLEAFEEMLRNVQKEYDSIQRQMDDLKEKGKTKSATYRQLMGRKMTYQSMISMYEVYGLL